MRLHPIRKIGAGTYGCVYLVETRDGDRRTYALKVFNVLYGGTTCAGVVREFVSLNSITPHPRVCRALRTWISEEKAYILMPYYGENIISRVRRGAFQKLGDIVRIMLDVTQGIMHMHAHGWMHRDIKPENIFLSPSGAVVGDFSLARFGLITNDDDIGGVASTEVCTLWTRAPELVYHEMRGCRAVKQYGEEVDVFSLGAVGLALVCGEYLLGRAGGSTDVTDSSQYLKSCLNIIGVTPRVITAYELRDLYPPYDKAVDRIMLHVPKPMRSEPHVREYIALVSEMAQLDPLQRPSLAEVSTRLAALPHSISLRNEVSVNTPSPCALQSLLVPDQADKEDTRRASTSVALWTRGSQDGIPYSLLCQGLHFVKQTRYDVDMIVFILSQLHRFPEKRALRATLLTSCDVTTDYELEMMARRMQKAGPFLACAFACEFALGEWTCLADLEKGVMASEFPSIAMDVASPFFDALGSHWTSQQSLRSTLSKL